MKPQTTVRATLPLEKHPESIVSWLVIGLALLIFACHAGAAIWTSSSADNSRASSAQPTEVVNDTRAVQ